MGTARLGRDRRDLSTHETLYVDPDYDRLRAAAGFAPRDERITRTVLAGGSTLETLGGLVAFVVSITGFSTLPLTMAAVAVIALGFALLAQGLAVMSRWRDALARMVASRTPRRAIAGGVSSEVLAGLVGIGIGVLALSGVNPVVLLPAAVTIYGAALMLGGATQPDLVYLAPERDPRIARVTYSAIQTSGGVMVLAGVGAAVLGVLALVGVGPPLILTLVALLALGATLLFAGGALTARLARRVAHR